MFRALFSLAVQAAPAGNFWGFDEPDGQPGGSGFLLSPFPPIIAALAGSTLR